MLILLSVFSLLDNIFATETQPILEEPILQDRITSHSDAVLSIIDSISSEQTHPDPDSNRCVRKMKLPCSINGVNYICANPKSCGKGSYGTIYKVHRLYDDNSKDPNIYTLKLGTNGIDEWSSDNLDETMVTWKMQHIICPIYKHNIELIMNTSTQQIIIDNGYCPTAKIFNYDDLIINEHDQNIALIMMYYKQGSAQNIEQHKSIDYLRSNRDFYVFKLMHDLSFVLKNMWENSGFIDRDIRLSNIMIDGDLTNWRLTTFVKIDYGIAIHSTDAMNQLADYKGRKKGFSYAGSHVK